MKNREKGGRLIEALSARERRAWMDKPGGANADQSIQKYVAYHRISEIIA